MHLLDTFSSARLPRLLLIVAALLGAGWLMLYASMQQVRHAATAAAAGRAFCIQTPEAGQYVSARSDTDLSWLKMRSRGGSHHAVLAVKQAQGYEYYHWSYWQAAFVKDVPFPQALYCAPREDFLHAVRQGDLPVHTSMQFQMRDLAFSVPLRFRPRWLSSADTGLSFYAASPDFEAPASPSDIESHVALNFQKTRLMELWRHKESTMPIEHEYGLSRQLFREGTMAGVQYVGTSAEGAVTTLIQCAGAAFEPCLHVFESGGWTYSSRLRHADLPRWQLLQERLVARTRGWVAGPPA